MLKLLSVLGAAVAIGFGLGHLRASMTYGDFQEKFLGARPTLAESRGEIDTSTLLERPSARAKLEVVGGTEYDFGVMKHGETMSHDFLFRNIGQDPLNLEMVGSTCKCTVGDLDKSILYPGEETKVTLTWTAQSLTADFGQTATIYTTDPKQTEVKLKIFGRVAHSFVAEPPSISLGSFSADEQISRKLHVFTYLENSEDLGEFTWSDEDTRDLVNINVKKVELDPEQFPEHQNAFQAHEVNLEIAPGMPLGNVGGRVLFTTDQGESVGTLEIPVSGTVVGDFSIFGGASYDSKRNVVDMGTVDSGEGASVTVWLAAQGEQQNEVQPSVQSITPEEALQIEIGDSSQRGRRRVFPIRISVPKGSPEVSFPGTAKGEFGKVVINTGLDVVSQVPIYIRLIVKD